MGNYPPELKFQIKTSKPEDAAQAAEELATAGVNVIKAYPMTFDEYKAVADVAHKHGIKVHAHVYDAQNVRDALHAGIDVLTHVGAASRQTYDPELVREIVEASRPVVPTAALWFDVFPATIDFPERLQDPRLKRDFPPDIYNEVQESFKNWHTLGYFRNWTRVKEFGSPLVKQWINSGAVIGMGTDSGTPMNFHTEALWREIKVFTEQGMSPLRAIEAATRINAQILGRGNDLGTIEVGKLADVIVVKGNPLVNIFALDDPVIVVKGGVVYKDDAGNRRPSSSNGK
jgi:imidazolonepropionase-like amidohydrolase